MRAKHMRVGSIIHVKTQTDEFEYKLLKQDIKDIKAGEWEALGIEIIDNNHQSKLLRIYHYFKYRLLNKE